MKKSLMLMVIVMLAGVVLLSGCQGKQAKESLWGVYQEPIKSQPLPKDSGANELKVLWSEKIGSGASTGFALLKPAYYNGNLYIANRAGEIYCFDSATGDQYWKQNLAIPIFSAIAVNDNVAVVTHDNGDVTALNANNGEIVWTTAIKRQISAVPAVGSGRVLVRTADGLIIGLDRQQGSIVWQIKKITPGLSVHGDSTPVITGDAVLIGLSNGKLIANNVINGRDYWEVEISFIRGQNELERLTDSDTVPIIKGSTVYTATYQGNVIALQLQDATVKWRTKISTRLAMASSQNYLFITGELGEIIALNINDGSIAWQQPAFQGHGMSQPVILKDRVIVGDARGRIHTLDMVTGELVQSKKVVSGAVISIITENSQLTVFSSAGHLSTLTL